MVWSNARETVAAKGGAGALKHRVSFQQRALTSDGLGNSVGDWQEQFACAAGIAAKFGGETVTAQRLASRQPCTITVRASSRTREVTTEWRAVDTRTGAAYEIQSIADPDDRGQYLEMLCETGPGVAT